MAAPPEKKFSSEFFNCFADIGIFVVTYFVPCVTYAQNVQALTGSANFGAACCSYCCLASLGCPCVVAAGTRAEIRQKYNLREEPLNDCLMHLPCLSACSLCQEARELQSHGARKPVFATQ